MNKVIVLGRLTADPELQYTPSGVPYVRFAVAVDRPKGPSGEKQADFFNCTAWKARAELLANYFEKGKPIIIEGSLSQNRWEDTAGVKHSSIEIIAQTLHFVPGNSAKGGAAAPEGDADVEAEKPAQEPLEYDPFAED